MYEKCWTLEGEQQRGGNVRELVVGGEEGGGGVKGQVWDAEEPKQVEDGLTEMGLRKISL